MAELGRGLEGRVFLATQPSLADRPLVLKLTPSEGQEQISLARFHHTHIVPLLDAQEIPERNLRLLCMPYQGGATLAQIQEELRPQPAEQRSGQSILEALDLLQARSPIQRPHRSSTSRNRRLDRPPFARPDQRPNRRG